MILQAKKDFQLSLHESTMIGDRLSDMIAAYRSGIGKKYLISQEEIISEKCYHDIHFRSHTNLINFIKANPGIEYHSPKE